VEIDVGVGGDAVVNSVSDLLSAFRNVRTEILGNGLRH
jgi:hypothetical protein